MDAIITLTGNLGADPRIRMVGPEQHLFTEFSIAHTPRIQRDGQWQDGATTWYRITCWRRLAENAFQSLRRGDSVIVHGKVRTHEWADKDGVVQTRDEIEALSIGPDLNRGSVVVVRRPRPVRTADQATPGDAQTVDQQTVDPQSADPRGDATGAAGQEPARITAQQETTAAYGAPTGLPTDATSTPVTPVSPGTYDADPEPADEGFIDDPDGLPVDDGVDPYRQAVA